MLGKENGSIKLSQFEIDLLESMPNQYFTFWNCPELCEMQRRGYFKGIPCISKIKDVLASCREEINDEGNI